MSSRAFSRFCAWSCLVSLLMFFVGLVIAHYVPPPAPGASASTIARFYQQHHTGLRIGGWLTILSSMFWAAYIAVIAEQTRRIPGTPVSGVYLQIIAGASAAITFAIPGLLMEVAAFRPARPDSITLALNDLMWIPSVIPWPPFMAQYYAFSYAVLTDRQERPLFPRWLAYLNLWAILGYVPSMLLPFVKSGAFDWRGAVVFWFAGVVFCTQGVANVVCLLRAIDRSDPVPAPDGTGSPRVLASTVR